MAIYHFSAKVISRANGSSAVASAAYRSASELHDDRLGRIQDFSNKAGVVHSEIMLPEGAPERFPVKTRKLKRGAQTIWLLYLSTAGRDVWLSQRPTPGVWAGLYCVPLFEDRASLQATLPEPWHHALVDGPVVRHVLTHKDLHLHPVALSVPDSGLQPTADGHWFTAQRWPSLGLPAPIRKLLQGG